MCDTCLEDVRDENDLGVIVDKKLKFDTHAVTQNKEYPERLKKLKLPSLAYRRRRGDMIEVYKYTHIVYIRSPFSQWRLS